MAWNHGPEAACVEPSRSKRESRAGHVHHVSVVSYRFSIDSELRLSRIQYMLPAHAELRATQSITLACRKDTLVHEFAKLYEQEMHLCHRLAGYNHLHHPSDRVQGHRRCETR